MLLMFRERFTSFVLIGDIPTELCTWMHCDIYFLLERIPTSNIWKGYYCKTTTTIPVTRHVYFKKTTMYVVQWYVYLVFNVT